jgi:F-type H+-transporting ATPase subunit epsilon
MFKLTLVTPQKKLLTDVEVDEVIVPANRGELNILPGHAPLMTTLKAGRLRVKMNGQTKVAAISWGYCEVTPHGVNVLADSAEWPEEIDIKRVEDQIRVAQERLQTAGLSPADYALAQRKLEKELARQDTKVQS